VGDGARRTVDVRYIVAQVEHHRVNAEVVEHDASKDAQVDGAPASTVCDGLADR